MSLSSSDHVSPCLSVQPLPAESERLCVKDNPDLCGWLSAPSPQFGHMVTCRETCSISVVCRSWTLFSASCLDVLEELTGSSDNGRVSD